MKNGNQQETTDTEKTFESFLSEGQLWYGLDWWQRYGNSDAEYQPEYIKRYAEDYSQEIMQRSRNG